VPAAARLPLALLLLAVVLSCLSLPSLPLLHALSLLPAQHPGGGLSAAAAGLFLPAPAPCTLTPGPFAWVRERGVQAAENGTARLHTHPNC
jgi:hypothetical protein